MLLLDGSGEPVLDGDGEVMIFSKPTYRPAESSTVIGRVDTWLAVAFVVAEDDVFGADRRKDVRVGCGEVGFNEIL